MVRRATHQTNYKMVLEDWLWHAIFPFAAYVMLLVSALTLHWHPTPSLFAIGMVALWLLFIGIHNAWDAVTYFAKRQQQQHQQHPPPSNPPSP